MKNTKSNRKTRNKQSASKSIVNLIVSQNENGIRNIHAADMQEAFEQFEKISAGRY